MTDKQKVDLYDTNEVLNYFVRTLETSPDMSRLEKVIVQPAAEEMRRTKSWAKRIMDTHNILPLVRNYVNLVACCAEETGNHSYGYTALKRGREDEELRTLQEQRLNRLAQAKLIAPNGNTMHKFEIMEVRDAQNDVIGGCAEIPKTSKFYISTPYGKELLEEYRKMRAGEEQ